MGSLATSTPLSPSSSFLHCNTKLTLHNSKTIPYWNLHRASKTPNFRLHTYRNSPTSRGLGDSHMRNVYISRGLSGTQPENASIFRCFSDTHRGNASISRGFGNTHVASPSHACGFKSRVYVDEWTNAATSGLEGVYAQQTPANAQRSAEAEVMGLLLRERIVMLGENLDDFVADGIVSQLLLLDAQDPNRDIRLFINCPGGSISSAMAIFDAIQFCRADVSTIGFGMSASTASILLAAGTRGKRYAMPNTRIMVHQPLGGISGAVSDVEVQAAEMRFHKANVIRILSEITGRTDTQIEKDIDRDNYMSPVEAMEFGIIDGVIDRETILPLEPVPSVREIETRPLLIDAIYDFDKSITPDVPDDEIY